MNPDQLFYQAKDLLNRGQLDESLAAFTQLTSSELLKGEAFYGIGFVEFKRGNLESSNANFKKCLAADPQNANAAYYMGRIAELQGEVEVAQVHYRKALTLQPDHLSAAQKITPNGGTSQGHGPLVTSSPPPTQSRSFSEDGRVSEQPVSTIGQVDTVSMPNVTERPLKQNFSFFKILASDPSPEAREAAGLIESLNLSVVPRLSAFLGSFLVVIFGILLPIAICLFVIATGHQRIEQSAFYMACLVVVLFGLGLILLILQIKSTRFTFQDGLLTINRGILAKFEDIIELYRIEGLALHQTFMNRLTGNATITIKYEGSGKHGLELELQGLAKADDVRIIFRNLRLAVTFLRSGRWGKGIYY